MRGRRPRPLTLGAADRAVLQQVARADSLPWFQVRRARIGLAIAPGERSQSVAVRMECDEATVWRTRRRHEDSGVAGLMAAPSRSGRPPRIPPPAGGPGRRPGLPGARRQGAAHHPLVQPRPGAAGRRRRHRPGHRRPGSPPHPEPSGPATARRTTRTITSRR